VQQRDYIRVGAEVVDRDGDKIGTIDEQGSNYFVVTKGLIFPKDIYVPLTAIDTVDADQGRVHLNVDKDEIDSFGWEAPVATDASASGDAAYVEQQTSYTGDTLDQAATTGFAGETMRVPVHEEELRVETTRAAAGEVEVRKDVVTEEQTLEVPVTREEVEIRRFAVDRPVSEARIVDTGDTIRVPVIEERVVVNKDVRVAEEVEISKRAVTETERVSDTVRREEINVEREGDVDVTGDAWTGGSDRT
jgi:uncharacterized protein (TIGR02271 family)